MTSLEFYGILIAFWFVVVFLDLMGLARRVKLLENKLEDLENE